MVIYIFHNCGLGTYLLTQLKRHGDAEPMLKICRDGWKEDVILCVCEEIVGEEASYKDKSVSKKGDRKGLQSQLCSFAQQNATLKGLALEMLRI